MIHQKESKYKILPFPNQEFIKSYSFVNTFQIHSLENFVNRISEYGELNMENGRYNRGWEKKNKL